MKTIPETYELDEKDIKEAIAYWLRSFALETKCSAIDKLNVELFTQKNFSIHAKVSKG
jgi:hypothetical protein